MEVARLQLMSRLASDQSILQGIQTSFFFFLNDFCHCFCQQVWIIIRGVKVSKSGCAIKLWQRIHCTILNGIFVKESIIDTEKSACGLD